MILARCGGARASGVCMFRYSLAIIIGTFLLWVGYDVFSRYHDNNAAFFRSEHYFKRHYKSHKDGFDAFARVMEKHAPIGDSDLCVTRACLWQKKRWVDQGTLDEVMEIQKSAYPRLIAGLQFPEGAFLQTKASGEVLNAPLSYSYAPYSLNITLHYNGATPLSLPICEGKPKDRSGGECAIPLSDTWFVRYAWVSQSLFGPEPGTAEAECEAAGNQSFAAYTACLEKSDAPREEPKCDGTKLSTEDFNKCIRDLIAEAQGR